MAASTNFERFPAGTVSTISLAARLREKIRTTRVLPRRLPRLRPAPLRRPPLRPLIPAIFHNFCSHEMIQSRYNTCRVRRKNQIGLSLVGTGIKLIGGWIRGVFFPSLRLGSINAIVEEKQGLHLTPTNRGTVVFFLGYPAKNLLLFPGLSRFDLSEDLNKPGDYQAGGGSKDTTGGDPPEDVHRNAVDLIAHDRAIVGHQHDQKHQRRS